MRMQAASVLGMTATNPNPPLVVGLNGAWQRRIGLQSLTVGSVNRASESSSGPGGKGQGAWLASEALQAGASLAQFVGAVRSLERRQSARRFYNCRARSRLASALEREQASRAHRASRAHSRL
jgi:fructose-1-phosphate kinase PfkB-like protein